MGILDQMIAMRTGQIAMDPMLQSQPQTPVQTAAPAQQEQGILGKLASGFSDYTGDPEKMARLAMAFNSMRIEPDQGLAAALADRAKTAQAIKLAKSSANKTAEALRAAGREDLAAQVEQNPLMAKEIYSAYLSSLKDGGLTETMQTRIQTIKALGIDPNSEEGRAILAGQNPSDVGKTEREGLGNLRKEFIGLPLVKSFSDQSQALGRIVSSATKDSPAGDLALIFNFMKMLDPGSTVREGEFANAQNAAGVPERIVNLYNNVVNGTRLNQTQRQDFVSTAYEVYSQAEQSYKSLEDQYNEIGQRVHGAKEKFLPDFRSKADLSSILNPLKAQAGIPGSTIPNYVMPSQAPQYGPNVQRIIDTMTPQQIQSELNRLKGR